MADNCQKGGQYVNGSSSRAQVHTPFKFTGGSSNKQLIFVSINVAVGPRSTASTHNRVSVRPPVVGHSHSNRYARAPVIRRAGGLKRFPSAASSHANTFANHRPSFKNPSVTRHRYPSRRRSYPAAGSMRTNSVGHQPPIAHTNAFAHTGPSRPAGISNRADGVDRITVDNSNRLFTQAPPTNIGWPAPGYGPLKQGTFPPCPPIQTRVHFPVHTNPTSSMPDMLPRDTNASGRPTYGNGFTTASPFPPRPPAPARDNFAGCYIIGDSSL